MKDQSRDYTFLKIALALAVIVTVFSVVILATYIPMAEEMEERVEGAGRMIIMSFVMAAISWIFVVLTYKASKN